MCFSPEASFTGGVILISIGVFTVAKVHKPSQIVFAIIPLFFGIQQIVEGLLWISLPDPHLIYLQKLSTYWFLIMAQVLWPIMIPLSVLLMEENIKKKKVLRILMVMGIALSAYYASCLIFLNVNPQIMQYHIRYNTDFPRQIKWLVFSVYLLVTIAPLFISSIKKMHWFGIIMILSVTITVIFFTQFLTSVWCFFAALISGLIYLILHDSKKKFKLEKLSILK